MQKEHTIPKVVNINNSCSHDVYIGRPSKWGNPFKIGRDGNRPEVIKKYRLWLLNNDELLSEILTLDGKILACHCKPKRCHGDIIIETIDAIKNEQILFK